MALVEYVDPDSTEESVRELLQTDAETYDRPSLFARAMANTPEMLDARMGYADRVLEAGHLDTELKELAYVAVSVTNDSRYCVASHTEHLVEHLGVPAERVAAIQSGDSSVFDERERLAIEFAESVASDPDGVGDDELDALRDAGFDDAAVVELLTVCATAVAANTIVDTLSIAPEDRETVFSGYER